MNLLEAFGNANERVERAVAAFKNGNGVLVVDNEDRENEGDLIFSAELLTAEQIAQQIRDCSGIICLCLSQEKVRELGLPMMVEKNSSAYGTAFTISIDGKKNVTTGVSATDRLEAVRATIADGATLEKDLVTPGHMFPLVARPGGTLERGGHTEATVDLARLAGQKPCGVLCELTNPDGTMMRLPEVAEYARRYNYPLVSIDDIIQYRKTRQI
ncbi:MAG: 3,4-dihydroxy-2-butanone-4-phosphate synthase [Opitutales bacterium]|nr:3,4-dihydroxy-2-butanone-4-phosphate synthase [Opitutales bacterium]